MKLDRNTTNPRRGKYALIKLRETPTLTPSHVAIGAAHCNIVEVKASAIDFGCYDDDFFVIRLKDKYAGPALRAYAEAARQDDEEYADEISQLAINAETHPNKKRPD